MNDTRPAGIGELLDRAVAMYVGSFVPIVVILAVGAVPSTILLSFAGGWSRAIVDFNRTNARTLDPYVRSLAFHHLQSDIGALMLYSLIGGAITLLSATACLIYILSLDEGDAVGIGEAFRRAAGRWVSQVGLTLVMVGSFVALYVGLAIVLVLFGLTLGAIAAGLRLLGVVGGVVAAILSVVLAAILFAVLLAAVLGLVLVDQIGMVEVAAGEGNAFRAFGAGRRVVLRRREWRSTLAFAGTVLAIEVLGVLASMTLGALLGSVRLAPIAVVLGAVVGLVLNGALKCFIVLCVRELNDRRTGDDLLALLDGAPA